VIFPAQASSALFPSSVFGIHFVSGDGVGGAASGAGSAC